MKKFVFVLLGSVFLVATVCQAQQSRADVPDAPSPAQPKSQRMPSYSPPTQAERFKDYLHHTYGLASILEAGARGGIEQARDRPSEWPQGGQGYADRFGSAMGMIAIRGTTEYLIGAALKEDLRITRCRGCSLRSKFTAALKDTFTARKGGDGHTVFSVARLAGPISGNLVAVNTWYPSDTGRSETVKGIALSYGFKFGRNFVKELIAH